MKQLMENWRRYLKEVGSPASQALESVLRSTWDSDSCPRAEDFQEVGFSEEASAAMGSYFDDLGTSDRDATTGILRLEKLMGGDKEFMEIAEGGFAGATEEPYDIREAISLDIEVGDIVLGGKYKNKRMEVKEIGPDELGQPTINGKPILKFRIEKHLPDEKKSKKTLEAEKDEG